MEWYKVTGVILASALIAMLSGKVADTLVDPTMSMEAALAVADDATYGLGAAGYNALKLVPYGAFDELLPWLLRRLEELTAAMRERSARYEAADASDNALRDLLRDE